MEMTVVGIVSGTSFDAVDTAAARFSLDGEKIIMRPLGARSTPLAAPLRHGRAPLSFRSCKTPLLAVADRELVPRQEPAQPLCHAGKVRAFLCFQQAQQACFFLRPVAVLVVQNGFLE